MVSWNLYFALPKNYKLSTIKNLVAIKQTKINTRKKHPLERI
uniref:Uncharacterized protein n=1 Tax=Arundo donax TaxID=35708 RepID=A0A0A8ZDJ5_ARUDO